ncbi:MAG: hypothetical protein GQ574_26790 [Crocinitomix sp.]|nr:hypothetical protein [Crocinitomix sp.]
MKKGNITKAPKGKEQMTLVVGDEKQSRLWSNLTPEQRKLISTIALWGGISLGAAVLIFFGYKMYQKVVSNSEKGKSFGEDEHATWADQIHTGISNDGVYFGTDENLIRKTLIEIPSRQDFEKVEKSYKKQFKANMSEVIRNDLSSTEYNEMKAIIDSKPLKAKDAGIPIYDPNGWALRLNSAFNYQTWGWFWGTDMEAVRAVLMEIPTQQGFVDTAEAYKAEYGVLLMDDLLGDLSISEIVEFTELIKGKPIQ